MPEFCHLHCHSQFSLLDGASEIGAMMDKVKADGQRAVALTDHGNMFGVYKFVNEANKRGIKPIIGCEFYMVEDRRIQKFEKSKGERDTRYHQLLLAKNKQGYENLSKLCSLGFTEGLYSKYPRIDKEILVQYTEGVIATSCCIGAEIPQALVRKDYEEADRLVRWWLDIFGEDFYIELQRHQGLDNLDVFDKNGKRVYSGVSQEDVNQELIKLARKYNIKLIATNDAHYVEEEDWMPHDILLCVNTGSNFQDIDRFKFPSSDFFMKSQEQMSQLFGDVPEAIANTMEIESKIDTLSLSRDIILPAFPLPAEFADQDAYLRELTYQGARRRYTDITPEIRERIDFELGVIQKSGYPGYFLIVQDFTTAAREMDVSVGPGRGSAAGSVVAYCLGITNMDPIKYDLLFERFLNPERVSMPDIDIDFDDEGRGRVIDYVIDKYGRNQVAQIITYGTMAAKSSIKDVGRVMQIPLYEVNSITKDFPANPSASLNKILAPGEIDKKLKDSMDSEDLQKAMKLRKMSEAGDDIGRMLTTAMKLEGSVRNTGIHACGVIITPDEITKYVPVSLGKDNDMLVSQFDNSAVEDAGLLKMDFLGLRTLSIIKDAVKMVKRGKGVVIDIENVDLTDEKTFELFSRGETVGIFQYESIGMQNSLVQLKPNKMEDLIAMNALYRPGPIKYIPEFIQRKHGTKKIVYDLPDMEEYLEETYGITVYQEQVMLLSQKLAGFSKGQADVLRKAMGKKKKKLIDELWPLFLAGCQENGHDEKTVKKIWQDWEAFASYAFNKSHSTCYAFIGFQTAYLKAHFPEEYMASVLNHNRSNIEKVNFFLRECKRMGITVLGPDINDSFEKFHVNKKNQIRFGLTALKGVGEGPVNAILEERVKEGEFENVFDFMRRVDLRSVNKKCVESLVYGGAFDHFDTINRATYFAPSGKYDTAIELLIKYGNAFQDKQDSQQASLFGDNLEELIEEPKIEPVKEWDSMKRLSQEKEVTGIYISGHPLDDYSIEIDNFVDCNINRLDSVMNQTVHLAGIVTEVYNGEGQRGTEFLKFTVQDYDGTLEMKLYNEMCAQFKSYITLGNVLYITGRNMKSRNDYVYFKVMDIKMLDTIGKELTKHITLKLNLDYMSMDDVSDLCDIIEQHPGMHLLKMKIVDNEDIHGLSVYSKLLRVNAGFEFVNAIEKMGIPYKIN